VSAYRLLLRTPGAASFFFTAAVGRIGIAMTSLGIIWLVHDRTGSYASAGLVTGAFAVAEGVVGPQVARLLDRVGQARVLSPLLAVHAVAVTALVASALVGAPVPALMAVAVGMGGSIPQLGALTSARWAALVRQLARPELLPTAFSLESLSNATAYLVGPVLVSLIGGGGHPAVGTATAGGLVVVGGVALAAQRRTAPPVDLDSERPARQPQRLLAPVFLLLLGVNLAIGVYFGAVQVSVTAFALEQQSVGSTASLYSGTGLLGGWLFGLCAWRSRPAIQLLTAAGALTLAALLISTAHSVAGVAVALGLAGFAVAPILVLASVLTEQQVDRAVLTQAFTWLNSASAAGAAGAAAVAGVVIDTFHARGGFGLAATAALTMTLLAALIVRADTPRGRAGPH
jgi:MFS family permease